MKKYKNNATELSFKMNCHEVRWMLHGLEEYVHCIKTDKLEAPDYKLLMIGTARIACEKLEKWAVKHDWNSAVNLAWIKNLKDDLIKERVKQDKAWEKLSKKLKKEREERKKHESKGSNNKK